MVGLVRKLPLIVAMLAVGCGDELAGDGDENPALDGGTGGNADGDDGNGSDAGAAGDDDGAGLDESGGDEGGTGGGVPGDDDGGRDSCNIDCGNGYCDINADLQAQCVCDDGFAAYGMRCLPCAQTDSPDIDLQRLELTVDVLVNGETPPDSDYEDAILWLRDRASGDQVRLGHLREGQLSATVLPGNYEFIYARETGGQIVPRNGEGVLRRMELSESQSVLLDIDSVRVTGDLQLGGEAPPDSQYETGWVVFIDTQTQDEIVVGQTRDGHYDTRLMPGEYNVHYRRILGGDVVPRNGDARIGFVSVPRDGSKPMDAPINVPVVEISGDYVLDSAKAPEIDYESALISLQDQETGDQILLGETQDGTFTQRVIPGEYAVVYDRKLGGDVVPINEHAVLSVVDVAETPDFTVSMETATVSGAFTLNDGPMALSPGEDGFVALVDTSTGDEIILGNLSAGAYERRVLVGQYDVVYSQLAAGDSLPANTHARLMGVDLSPGMNPAVDINVASGAVSGEILLNGAPPPTSEFSDARLFLRNPQTGDSVLLGNTREGSFAGNVIPGTYDVVYVVETAGDDVPINRESTVDVFTVAGGDELFLDIPVVDFAPALAVNGGPAPIGENDLAALSLYDVASQDKIFLGSTDAGEFLKKLTSGTYVVVYEGLASSGAMPSNEQAGIACVQLGG